MTPYRQATAMPTWQTIAEKRQAVVYKGISSGKQPMPTF
jgi:hypothetical protein